MYYETSCNITFIWIVADYRKWQLPEKKLYHDPNLYCPPEAPFEGEPTYKSDYQKKPFAMRQVYTVCLLPV